MGPYDRLFDFNRDGELDDFERAAAFEYEEEMLRRTSGETSFDSDLDDLDEDDLDDDDLDEDELDDDFRDEDF